VREEGSGDREMRHVLDREERKGGRLAGEACEWARFSYGTFIFGAYYRA
jgi:hypothetical protein